MATVQMSLRIPEEWQARYEELARRNFRYVSREILIAMSRHYEKETGQPLELPTKEE